MLNLLPTINKLLLLFQYVMKYINILILQFNVANSKASAAVIH